MKIKKITAIALSALLIMALAACGNGNKFPNSNNSNDGEIILDVYAPDQCLEVMTTLAYDYQAVAPGIQVRITYDDGLSLAQKIAAGYKCDIYVSDYAELMDALDKEASEESLDFVVKGTRCKLMSGPDADSALAIADGFETIEEAVITDYYAAVIKTTGQPYEAGRFLDFMRDASNKEMFKMYNFTIAE